MKPKGKAAPPLALLIILQPLCVATYQYLAKSLGGSLGQAALPELITRLFLRPLFWALICVEALGLLVWLAILSRLELAKAFPLTAISYGLVIGVSVFAFHEPIEMSTILGSGLILAGIGILASEKE